MNVTLKQNSWHFKLYSKVIDDNPPKTLCPYFWSLVAIFLFSPFLLSILLIKRINDVYVYVRKNLTVNKEVPKKTVEEIIAEMDKKLEKHVKKQKRIDLMVGVGALIFKWVVLPLLVVGFIYLLFLAGNKIGWFGFLISIVVGIGIMAFIFGIIWTVDNYGHKISKPIGRGLSKLNPTKWSITQIVGGMIYATYIKACPVIEWEEKITKEKVHGHN